MSGAGRYGSGQHTDVMARALAESADPILAQDYQTRQQMRQQMLDTGLQRAGQWAQETPALDQAQYLPGAGTMACWSNQRRASQQQLADQIKLYNAQQAYPWEQLARDECNHRRRRRSGRHPGHIITAAATLDRCKAGSAARLRAPALARSLVRRAPPSAGSAAGCSAC